MKIAVPIQADAKHCCWCHFNSHVGRLDQVIRWCDLFARELTEDERGALRLNECKESEVGE